MTDWTAEAENAIRICETWAAKVVVATKCQLFLFGSAIYKGGEQFIQEQSDLDIVCLLPEPNNALSRLNSLKTLYRHKADLELEMIRALSRTTCVEPGISIVVITELELRSNIHKSGARSFFNKNFFYDLVTKQETLGLHNAGTRSMRDEHRQALEYVQAVRNKYLSVCANGSGGIDEFLGLDPMPKQLLRAAAQLNTDAAEGEWYDTRLGLEMMHSVVGSRRAEDKELKSLFESISVRRGGRGHKRSLSSDDQMLLAELLFDLAGAVDTEEVVTWRIRLIDHSISKVDANIVFFAILRLVPDSRLIGVGLGSLVLTIRSGVGGYNTLLQLQQLGVLAKLLKVEQAELMRIDDASHHSEVRGSDREQRLIERISQWQPADSWTGDENEFALYLQHCIETNSELTGVHVLRNIQVGGVEVPHEMDFLLSWKNPDGQDERIGIEITRLRSPSTFFYKVSQLLPLGRPVIFVIVGDTMLLDKLEPDIARLALLNTNVRVVKVMLSNRVNQE